MQNTTTFRHIDHTTAGAIAQAAQTSGFNITNVLAVLREGTTLRGAAVSSLYAGFMHAAKFWAGAIVLDLGDRPGLPGVAHQQSTRERAKTCAIEVRSWLNETRLINGVTTPLIHCTDAQRAQFDAIIDKLLRIAENGEKTE